MLLAIVVGMLVSVAAVVGSVHIRRFIIVNIAAVVFVVVASLLSIVSNSRNNCCIVVSCCLIVVVVVFVDAVDVAQRKISKLNLTEI